CETVEKPTDEEPLKVLSRAEPVLKLAKEIKLPKDAKAKTPDWSKVDAAFDRVKQAVARLQQKKRILARLSIIASKPSWNALLHNEAIIKEEEPNLPGLGDLPEVQNLIKHIFEGHKDSIKYVKNPPALAKGRGDKEEPAILFDPLLQGAPGNIVPREGIVL